MGMIDRVRAEIFECQSSFTISEIKEACRDVVQVTLRPMTAKRAIEPVVKSWMSQLPANKRASFAQGKAAVAPPKQKNYQEEHSRG